MSARVKSKIYYECPNCDNPQLREIIYRVDKSVDVEICSCGFPENRPDLHIEWRE